MAMTAKRFFLCVVHGFIGGAVAQTVTSDPTTPDWPTRAPPPTHPPIPSVSLNPLPSEFSDIPQSAVECWDSLITYSFSSSWLAAQIASGEVFTLITYTSPITITQSWEWPLESCSTAYPGLTTLCDGYPRANECKTRCVSTGSSSVSGEVLLTTTGYWLTPTWSTELTELPVPTCTVADDLSPLCKRFADAYSWRTENFPVNGTATTFLEPPRCAVSIPPTANPTAPNKRKCSFTADSYEAYYWPTPTATPSNTDAFCSPNATVSTATPTIPERPKTTVVSGITLTSPSVYHLLHNATILRSDGHASSIAYGNGDPIWHTSLTLPTLTLAQAPSSVLSQSRECHKPSPHGATRCTITYNPDFLIQDLFTVRAEVYYGEPLETPTTATICQESYVPTVALPLSEVAAQNGVGGDCEWTFEHSGRTTILGPEAYSVDYFGARDYHAITTGRDGTGGEGLKIARETGGVS